LKLDHRINCFQRLAALLGSGFSLAHALRLAAPDLRGATGDRLAQLAAQIDAGQDFPTALSQQKHYFGAWTVNLLSVGAASGSLVEVCEDLARTADRQKRHRRLYRSISFSLGAIGLSCATLGIALSGLGTSFWINLVFLGILLLIAYQSRNFLSNSSLTAWLLTQPVIGPILEARMVLKITELAVPLRCGLSPLAALELLRYQPIDGYLDQTLKKATKVVKQGKPLSVGFQNRLPSTALNMIRTGEEAGSLDDLLVKLAEYYESELDRQLHQLQGIMKPLGILAMGVIVLVLGISLIGQLTDNFGGFG